MKAKILTELKMTDGYLSGQYLCDKYQVSRTAIWKVINQLKNEGYEFESTTNKGYKLINSPDILSKEEIMSTNKAKIMGQNVIYIPSVGSTNTKAKALAEEGEAHGTLVVTNEQTDGRGRRGRKWAGGKNTNIAMTLLLRPAISPVNASMLTIVMAMAVNVVIKRYTANNEVKIKWPNDIVVDNKKICGILTEMSCELDFINYVVIGVGINVNNESFAEEISQMAGSLFLATGRRINRSSLVSEIMECFEKYYDEFIKTEDLSEIMDDYNSNLISLNKEVIVFENETKRQAVSKGINAHGELIIENSTGKIETIRAGEVSVRGLYGYT